MQWFVSGFILDGEVYVVDLYYENYQLKGIWKSHNKPQASEKYNAELDILLSIEKLLPVIVDTENHKSSTSGQRNLMTGTIDSIDEDLLHYFRLSENCLIMIESDGLRLNKDTFYLLEVPVEALEITPL